MIPSVIELFAHMIAGTTMGAVLFRNTLPHLDSAVLSLTGNRHTMTTLLASAPMVIVTSTGARTGKPRTRALLRVDDPQDKDRFAVLATNYAQSRLPGWYCNLKKHPRATCVIDGNAAPYITHEARDEEWEHFWGAAIDAFAGFLSYAQRLENVRSIPIIVCERE